MKIYEITDFKLIKGFILPKYFSTTRTTMYIISDRYHANCIRLKFKNSKGKERIVKYHFVFSQKPSKY